MIKKTLKLILLLVITSYGRFALGEVTYTIGSSTSDVTLTDTFVVSQGGKEKDGEVVIERRLTGTDKAKLVAHFINSKFPDMATQGKDNSGNLTNQVTVPDNMTFRVKVNNSKQPLQASGQPQTVAALGANFGLDGGLAGVDESGFESIFQASFGFDGIFVDSNLTFSQLSGPTIDNLLTDMFNEFSLDLPANLQSNLILDLSADTIIFAFPLIQSNFSYSYFTSDVDLQLPGGLQDLSAVPVPEPATIALITLGLGGLGFMRRRAH